MTTVSIALCTYNGQQYLQDQLDSYSRQTRLPDELVACDDASTDSTVAILTDYAHTAPFPVRLYRNEKQLGVTRNFEQATRLCEGEIILFSDQDDVWNSTKIEKMIHVFDTRPEVGAVCCDAELVDENLQPLGLTLWQHHKFSDALQKRVLRGKGITVLFTNNFTLGMALAFRARYRDTVVPFRTMGHDVWVGRLIAATDQVTLIQEPLVRYRQHGSNLSGPLAILSPGNQVGSIARVVTTARPGTRRRAFLKRAEALQELKGRLLELDRTPQIEATVPILDGIINHLQARATLPKTRLYRVPGVLKEMLTLRYYRFSNGTRGFLRDLLEKDASAG